MSKTKSPFEVIETLRKRNVEAIISQTRAKNPALKDYIRRNFASTNVLEGALMGEPVIEAAHPFEPALETMADLSGNLLEAKLVEALDGANDPMFKNRIYRFKKEWHPFKHQLSAWKSLCGEQTRSVLVSSGTGSGKTECFLVPLLNSIAKRQKHEIEGVEAIIIYPLNALIESQKERLSEWTKPFEGKIRFALYNSQMENEVESLEKRKFPEQVLDRFDLRNNPPPILVTNITMLEYMLVRKEDNSIIQKSKGKLKWIILDEAHTHVGAAAAELTLLIRRVLETFEVDSNEVRFVATSATMGSGETIVQDLKSFMASISGAKPENIDIILGNRSLPSLPPPREISGKIVLPDRISLDEANYKEELYNLLAPIPSVQRLIDNLTDENQGAVSYKDFSAIANDLGLDTIQFAEAVSEAASGDNLLAPLRIHAFHRVVEGLWSCINETCQDKPPGWKYGALFHNNINSCPSCKSPVLEVLNCSQCGEAVLHGQELSDGRIVTVRNLSVENEFEQVSQTDTVEKDEDENENQDNFLCALPNQFLFPTSNVEGVSKLFFDNKIKKRVDEFNENCHTFHCFEVDDETSFTCPACSKKNNQGSPNIFRTMSVGAPFILLNTNPVLLDGVPNYDYSQHLNEKGESENVLEKPGFGRQLLSFTDSRQGTARLSAVFEQESERNFARSFIYQKVQSLGIPELERQVKQENLNKLDKLIEADNSLEAALSEHRQRLKAELIDSPSISYKELKDDLSKNWFEIEWMLKKVWQPRDRRAFADKVDMADFMLKREIYRRSNNANTIETMGLAKVKFPLIDGITNVPNEFLESGANINDWHDFLYVIINQFIRANIAIDFAPKQLHWISHSQVNSYILPPKEGLVPTNNVQKRWPFVAKTGPISKIARIIFYGLKLDPKDQTHIARSNDIFLKAWYAIKPILKVSGNDNFILDFNNSEIGKLESAFICPTTHRVIDNLFMGFSPLSINDLWAGVQNEKLKPVPISLPIHPRPFAKYEEDKLEVESWLQSDEKVNELKKLGVWGALNDRASRSIIYYRSVEHSAQQDAPKLRQYEKEFKSNEINILNCSTTMEMGVDIGSVSTIMMNNLPPAIANYRQRVGRAGRRGQNLATAFTLCRDRPLDSEAFSSPVSFLKRKMTVPKVALDSAIIVQRNVNSWALAAFYRRNNSFALGANVGDFFGYNKEGKKDSKVRIPIDLFVEFIAGGCFEEENADHLKKIVSGTILENDNDIIKNTLDKIFEIKQVIDETMAVLLEQKKELTRDSAKNTADIKIKRLLSDFLLGYLADVGFLPGHGFPRDVVSILIPKKKGNDEDKRENRRAYGNMPSRELALAIREYAPGSEIVLDGLVYQSTGISLAWKHPNNEEAIREIQDLKEFWHCTYCGDAGIGITSDCRSCGGNVQVEKSIKPSGFVAAFDQDVAPHANVERLNYVKAETPIITLGTKEWCALATNELGQIRVSDAASVYYRNRGQSGSGYAICLHCGRSEADTSDLSINPLLDHIPLLSPRNKEDGSKNSDICPGNHMPFKTQRQRTLLHEMKTNAFEIQFSSMKSKEGALAFIAAFREALSQHLGIEPSEMEVSAIETRNQLGSQCFSAFLFDKASGGAGFSNQAEYLFDELISKVMSILDCRIKGCETGCVNCVVTRDTGSKDTPVNRVDALEWVEAYISQLGKVDEIDNFGISPRRISNVISEIDRYLASRMFKKHEIDLYLSETQNFNLDEWPDGLFISTIRKWSDRGNLIRLVIDCKLLDRKDIYQIFAWNRLISKINAQLFTSPDSSIDASRFPIAYVNNYLDSPLLFSSRSKSCSFADATYGKANIESQTPIIVSEYVFQSKMNMINLHQIVNTHEGYLKYDITNDFNGNFDVFGQKVAKLFKDSVLKISNGECKPIQKIEYSDPYCKSPLSAKLLLSTLANFAKEFHVTSDFEVVLITDDPSKKESTYNRLIHNDWFDFDTMEEIVTSVAKLMNLNVVMPYCKNIPHGRSMKIFFENKDAYEMIMDKGFGYWGTTIPVSFNFASEISLQIKDLLQKNALVVNRGFGASYLLIGKLN